MAVALGATKPSRVEFPAGNEIRMHATNITAPVTSRHVAVAGLSALAIWLAMAGVIHADDWPQWRGPGRDGVWHEKGILKTFPAGGPPIRWSVPVGPGYSNPVVARCRQAISCVARPEISLGRSNVTRMFHFGLER